MDAECVGDVPAAEVGATPELVTGLGMRAATGIQLSAGGLAAGERPGLPGGGLPWGAPSLYLPHTLLQALIPPWLQPSNVT